MSRWQWSAAAGLALAIALGTWGWVQRQPFGPDREPDAGPSTTAAAATAAGVLSAVDAADSALRVEVTDVGRPARDTIEVRLTVVNRDATRPLMVGSRFADSPAETGTVSAAYLADEPGAARYYVLRDEAGTPACSTGLDVLAPGERRNAWARFGSPGRGASRVALQLPGLPPLTGLALPPVP